MSTVAILGVGARVGSGVARAFAKNGDDLILVARSRDTASELSAELGGTVKVHTVEASVTAEASVERLVSTWRDAGTLPDTIIYNPAVNPPAKPSETTVEMMADVFDTILNGSIRLVQAVLPAFRERRSGTIIFTGGGFAVQPHVSYAPHSIAKAALRNFANNLYQEVIDEGIHAATVTIHRPVKPGVEMEACSAEFVILHNQARESWEWERSWGIE